jgi:PAS domain S-box-containing protein
VTHACAVIRTPALPADVWEENLADADGVRLTVLEPAVAAADGALATADCAIIDGRIGDPLRVARSLHMRERAVQLVIAAADGQRAELMRNMLFVPGLGETWILDADQVDAALVGRAAQVTAQRRGYLTTESQLRQHMAVLVPRGPASSQISDAYLAALVGVLPDPVISVGENGAVLSWNAAAERVLARSATEAVGKPIARALPVDPAGLLERLLQDTAADRPSWSEVRFSARGEEHTGEVVVAPVEAGGRRVSVIVLRDVTEQRRSAEALQWQAEELRMQTAQLQEQAAELERQTEELQSQSLMLEEAQADLRRVNERLREANVTLSERTAEAERARHEAESANRAKSDFLATMSHEIRTPINAILGYTDLLDMGLAGPLNEQQAAHLSRVRASSRHLLGLIEDVLDLSKIEAGRIEVAHEREPAINAIAAAIALVAPQAQERDIAIETITSERETLYVGDENRVRQIIVNLLTNAMKFSEPGSRVDVTCGTAADAVGTHLSGAGPWAWIRVTDRGIGIEEDERERVFLPFEQVEGGRTRTRGGTGLGLAISRQLARLMGGDLTLESTPGVGSEFTLWLPQREPAAPVTEPPPEAELELPAGVAEVGRSIQRQLTSIVAAYVARVRGDARIPMAETYPDALLEDHAASYVADLAMTLVILGDRRVGAADLLRDGSEIQRLIAQLHGRQRTRFGWTADALHTEFAILGEEIARVLQADEKLAADDVGAALDVIGRILARGEMTAVSYLEPGNGGPAH